MRHPHDKIDISSVRCFIVTVSTSKYREMLRGLKPNDASGDLAEKLVKEKGATVIGRALLDDDVHMIRSKVEELALREDIDLIIITGGTGLSPRDVTIEALRPLFEKEIEGFGELFRYLSYQRSGGIAMLSRATAGVVNRKVVVALPGSPDAVRLGVELIMDQITHILSIVREL
ncbi:MAG: MogA/MoaB family molybdenum cofactor biosynthesis protein [Sulfolobales archaeon]